MDPISTLTFLFFQDVTRDLRFQLRREKDTDVRFICGDFLCEEGEGSVSVVRCHRAVIAGHSKMLKNLFGISSIQQPGQEVHISMPEVEAKWMEKLVEYIYLGQTTLVGRGAKGEIQRICKQLGMEKLEVEMKEEEEESEDEVREIKSSKPDERRKPASTSPVASSSEDEDEAPPPKKQPSSAKRGPGRPRKESATEGEKSPMPKKLIGPASKRRTARSPSPSAKPSDSESSERVRDSSDEESNDAEKEKLREEEEKLKAKARKSKARIMLGRVEDSSDPEVKNHLKEAKKVAADSSLPSSSSKVANPFFMGSSSKGQPTPQKRRMAETDKKVASKDSKKMRQDGSGNSSSDVDTEQLAKRKKEALISKKKKEEDSDTEGEDETKDHESSSDDGSNFRPTPTERAPVSKAKPAPASAKKKTPSEKKAKPREDMFILENVNHCNVCNRIFVTKEGLKKHVQKEHGGGEDESGSEQSTKEESKKSPAPVSSEEEEEEEKNAAKYRKKTPTKIMAERKKSKRDSPDSSPKKESSPEPSSDNDSDCDLFKDKEPKSKRGRPKKAKTEASTTRTSTGGGARDGGSVECTNCSEVFETRQLLKNHFINHFKEQLGQSLPKTKPFKCPECLKDSRDKVTLLRHYAYTHKKILDFCSESDLMGRAPTGGRTPNATPKKPGPKRKKKAPSPDLAGTSDSEVEKTNGTKDEDTTSVPVNNKVSEDKQAGSSVHFSEDSDNDFPSSATSNAIKSFDDLFSKEQEKTEKKGPASSSGITFNKGDSDDSDLDDVPKARVANGGDSD